MTNQSGEQVYNIKMPELLFGAWEGSNRALPEGIYRSARTVRRGPVKLASVGYTGFTGEDLEEFWAASPDGGLVSYPYGDLLRVPAGTLALEFGLLGLMALGWLLSAGYLLAWPAGALLRRGRKKAAPPPDGKRALRRWAAALQLILLAAVGAATALLSGYFPAAYCVPVFGLCAALVPATAAVLVLLLFRRSAAPGRGRAFLNAAFCVTLAAAIANMLYWDMYRFWMV